MPPKKKKKIDCGTFTLSVNPGECIFCGQSEDNEEIYGKMMTKNGLSVHYFCMLFSSALKQLGKTDNDGFLGFLAGDIKKEVRRGKRLKCSFCKKVGATIGCVNTSCRQKYHYRCGLDNDVLYQFFGSFSSFCAEHRPHQAPPTRERLGFKGCAKSSCAICLNSVTTRASIDTLRSPCCKNSWFHRACIQAMANSSGLHFFKCPLCNNKELFQEEMMIFGIRVPDQDAAWELEPNAFQDLMHRVSTCHVENCLCPFGRDVNRLETEWEIMRCDICGSKGTHFKCSNLQNALSDWACVDCSNVAGKKPLVDKKTSPIPDDYLEQKMKNAGTSDDKKTENKTNAKKSPPLKKTKCKKTLSPCLKSKEGRTKSKSDCVAEDVPLSSFLEDSPHQRSDSEVEVNISKDSLDYLKCSLLSSGKRVSNSIKRKYKKRKPARHSLEIGVLVRDGTRLKKLKRAKSLAVVSPQEKPKTKGRSTKRSLMAEKDILELCNSDMDISGYPTWLKSLYETDIMTGKNLGNRFVKESPVLGSALVKCQSGGVPTKKAKKVAKKMEKHLTELKQEEVFKVMMDSESGKEDHHGNNISSSNNKELKQLLLTNFLSGGNSSHHTACSETEVKKTNKLRLMKKRKHSSEESIGSADIHQYLFKSSPKNDRDNSSSWSPGENSTSPQTTPQKENQLSDVTQEKIWGTPELKVKKKAIKVKATDSTTRRLAAPLQELSGNKGNKSCTLTSSKRNQTISAKGLTEINPSKESIRKLETSETGKNSKKPSSFNKLMKEATALDLNGNFNPAKKTRYNPVVNQKSGMHVLHSNKLFVNDNCSSRTECGMSLDKYGTLEDSSWGRTADTVVINLTGCLSGSSSIGRRPRKRRKIPCYSASTIVVDSDSDAERSPPILSPQDNSTRVNLVSDSETESLPTLSPQLISRAADKATPLIDLNPRIDSDTVSCEDNLMHLNNKFPSFNEFINLTATSEIGKDNMYCDLSTDVTDQEASLILIDDSDTENVMWESSDTEVVTWESTKNNTSVSVAHSKKRINRNSKESNYECTPDYSGFIIEPSSPSNNEWANTSNQSNLGKPRKKNATMPHTSVQVENSSSFVDLGRYQGSQMCVIS